MTTERVLERLAPFAVALILASLVLASFTVERAPRIAGAVAPMSDRADERVALIARRMVRELAPAATIDLPLVPDDADVEAVTVTAPAPTVVPTPEPTPEPTPRPTPAPLRTAPPAPVVSVSTVAAEQQTLALMNASRAAGGLVPLVVDSAVTSAARAHSEVESRYGYVYHDGPDGTARSRDAVACGTGWYGENTGKVWQGNVERLHVEFMSEPWAPINHRTNIMDPAFRRVGIGAVQGNDALYLTMVFCR